MKLDNWYKISIVLLLLLLVVGVLYFMSGLDVVVKNTLNPLNQAEWESPVTQGSLACEYVIEEGRPKICMGEIGTSVASWKPGADCRIAFTYTGLDSPTTEWKYYDDITLDGEGEYEHSDSAGYPGVYNFRILCASGTEVCTADDSIEVVPCDEEGNEMSIFDYICYEECTSMGANDGEELSSGVDCSFTISNPDCCCYTGANLNG